MRIYYFIVLITFANCESKMKMKNNSPICKKEPKVMSIHNKERTDDYHWLNNRESPDVIDYLNQENDYTDSQMKNTEDFQKTLFNELKSRIKEEDQSVPYLFNGYYYWSKYKKGYEHPLYLRRKENSEKEEIILDGQQMSKDYEFFNIGDYDVSIDNNIMAYSIDTLSRRIYNDIFHRFRLVGITRKCFVFFFKY